MDTSPLEGQPSLTPREQRRGGSPGSASHTCPVGGLEAAGRRCRPRPGITVHCVPWRAGGFLPVLSPSRAALGAREMGALLWVRQTWGLHQWPGHGLGLCPLDLALPRGTQWIWDAGRRHIRPGPGLGSAFQSEIPAPPGPQFKVCALSQKTNTLKSPQPLKYIYNDKRWQEIEEYLLPHYLW